MPTYDYVCQKCGHKFEEFQSMTAKTLRKCPVCGKLALKRLIGPGAGIIFKGSGFYQTDYPSDSYKSGASKANGGSKKTAKTSTKAASTSKDVAAKGDSANKKKSA